MKKKHTRVQKKSIFQSSPYENEFPAVCSNNPVCIENNRDCGKFIYAPPSEAPIHLLLVFRYELLYQRPAIDQKIKSNINRTNNFFITYKVLILIFRLNKSSTYHDIELPFNLNIASISLFGSKLVYSEYSVFYDDRIFRILYII